MWLRILVLLVIVSFCSCEEQSSEYLQSAIKDLSIAMKKNDRLVPVNFDNRDASDNFRHRIVSSQTQIPPLSLTQGELMDLYEATASKGGKTVTFPPENFHYSRPLNPAQNSEEEEYYYYFYPLKNFNNIDSTSGTSYSEKYPIQPHHSYHVSKPSTPNTLYNYHTHNHQVNVRVQQVKPVIEKKKSLEPFFMAISGFIGMAVMIVVSIICLPKFGKIKSRSDFDKFSTIPQVAFEILDGKDCSERFFCEIGKATYSLSLHNNRFTKLLKRITPNFLGKPLDKIGKFAQKKHKCNTITCKSR